MTNKEILDIAMRQSAYDINAKVPFYCCAWSNLKSVKNALRSGFVPGWVEMTVKAASLVENMNK